MKASLWSALAAVSLVLVGPQATPTAGDQPAGKPDQGKGFLYLLKDLKATRGCLGVETAMTGSGKQVIFAWFEDKKAVLRWYYGETHQQLMKQFFPAREYNKPLKDVPEDVGPIMAIASITMAGKPRFKETQLPISQIAIELYRPVSGGLFLGGRFAPEGLKIPDQKDHTPQEKK